MTLKSACVKSPHTLFPTHEMITKAVKSIQEHVELYRDLRKKRRKMQRRPKSGINLFKLEESMLEDSLPRTFHELNLLCKYFLDFTGENRSFIDKKRKYNIILLDEEIKEMNKNLEQYREKTQAKDLWHINTQDFRILINDWMTEIARVLSQKE